MTALEEKQDELIQYLNGLLMARPPLPRHEWAKRQKLFKQISKFKKWEETPSDAPYSKGEHIHGDGDVDYYKDEDGSVSYA